MNHTLMAAVLMTGVWLAVCVPPIAGLFKLGFSGTVAASILLAAGIVSPWVLAFWLEAGYADNGCLGTLLSVGAYAGVLWLVRWLGAGAFPQVVIALAGSIVAPWVFYGGIALAGHIAQRRAERNQKTKASGSQPQS